MVNSKSQIRKEALERRRLLTEQEKEEAAFLLTKRIMEHQWFDSSEHVLAFAPYGSEIDITEILREFFAKGKKVYLPKVQGEEMEFYRILSLDALEEGYKGIKEPKGDSERFLYEEATAQKTLMIMPGVAFDHVRNRIGYGKGYYDRYLQDKTALQLRTIAVGFQCQMVDEIPAQDTDIKPFQVMCV